jgi:hypothetical protein
MQMNPVSVTIFIPADSETSWLIVSTEALVTP